jgi:putative transposase
MCSDNASELIAEQLQRWLTDNKIRTIYIEQRNPWQNGFVESFHRRFRDECLNREQLWTLAETRVVIEDVRIKFDHKRPIAGSATIARLVTRRVYSREAR